MLTVGFVSHDLDDKFVRGTEMGRWTLEFLSAGSIRVGTRCGFWECEAPSAMLIAPFTPYEVTWAGIGEQWTEIYSIFDAPLSWGPLLTWTDPHSGIGVMHLRDSPALMEVEAAMQQALASRLSARKNSTLLTLNALEKALLILNESDPKRGPAHLDPRLTPVLDHMVSKYQQACTLEDLAKLAFLSPSRFAHLFKTQLGVAPMQYLEQYRLERAAEKLLTSGGSVEEVALSVGFNGAFHFSTRFRRQFGRSPSLYRKNPG